MYPYEYAGRTRERVWTVEGSRGASKSSASELQQWAARKIAESRPENFKEGVIQPIQEAK